MEKSIKQWPSVPCSSSQSSPSGGAEGAKSLTARTDGDPETDQQNPLTHGSLPTVMETLLPYEPRPSSQRGGRGRRRRGTLVPQPIPPREQNNSEYPRNFIISSTENVNLSTINTILAHRQLIEGIGGEPKSIIETRKGTLLIKVANRQQSERILNLKTLSSTPVKVEPNDHMNRTKGVIRYDNLPGFTVEQITEALSDFNVTEVYQMTKRSGDTGGIPIPVYVITFNSLKIPDRVNIGWTSCQVKQYIQRPRRCYKCQRFGHGAANCRATVPLCVNCGSQAHGECHNPSHCVNCGGDHPAHATFCAAYRYEEEIIATQTKENLTFREAREAVAKRFIRPQRSYSQAVQPTNEVDVTANQPTKAKEPLLISQNLRSEVQNQPWTFTTTRNRFNILADSETLPELSERARPERIESDTQEGSQAGQKRQNELSPIENIAKKNKKHTQLVESSKQDLTPTPTPFNSPVKDPPSLVLPPSKNKEQHYKSPVEREEPKRNSKDTTEQNRKERVPSHRKPTRPESTSYYDRGRSDETRDRKNSTSSSKSRESDHKPQKHLEFIKPITRNPSSSHSSSGVKYRIPHR